MLRNWIFIALLGFFSFACTGNTNNQEPDPALVEEINELDSTAAELESTKEEIETSAEKLDSLLNEIN